MIITCNNCNKRFDIDSNLIPDKGRLLQCTSCNHKWFFKKEIFKNTITPIVEDIENNSDNVFDEISPTNNVEINPSDAIKEEIENFTEEELVKKIEININEKPKKEIEPNINEKPKKEIEPNINEDLIIKKKIKKQKNFKIINILILAIISFVAIIIIVDTFKYPIGKVVPNIEFILYNLYESIKDISLFIIDLI